MTVEKIIEKKQKELEELNQIELKEMKLGDLNEAFRRREVIGKQIEFLGAFEELEKSLEGEQ